MISEQPIRLAEMSTTSEPYQFGTLTHLTPELERTISAFLETCPGFHYFQSPRFFSVCYSSKTLTPCYIIARQQLAIVGVLLYVKQVQITLPVASFLSSRTLILGGPVVHNNLPAIVDGLLHFYQNNCPATLYTQVRNLSDTSAYKDEFIRYGFAYDDHLTILIDLTRSETELWQDVSTKRRNQIRRAEKEGCIAEKQDSLPALRASYSILEEVYQRARLPLPDVGHFESLYQQADDHSGLRLFTVSWQGEIIACMFCLAHGNVLFDYYAGAYSRHYKKYPNDLLPWWVLRWAKENDFVRFDFGGAGKPGIPYGVRDYKKQFGGELVSYGRYERAHYPHTFSVIRNAFTLWQRFTR
ncbi:lipid II:glycine glycyltransferase FemX [Spirosoma validum]|uniref:GNAT family N-acetyltransferase n=1 Tax=Spirosoma validum TaxID=2771355 RepID=A0A927GCB4_9BACT|nr:GNAT family N-acetyltransferase [Spirosoma validum]MBD2752587.1 GNAT family N-acetyltransferase [Spirosoma validum]